MLIYYLIFYNTFIYFTKTFFKYYKCFLSFEMKI